MNRNYNALILKSVKITAGAILAILFASCLNLNVQRYSWHYHNFKHSKYKKETIQTALARGEAFCCALLVSFYVIIFSAIQQQLLASIC